MDEQSVSQEPWMIRAVLRTGLVQSKRGAQKVLLGITIVSTIIALMGFIDGTPREAPARYRGNIPDTPIYQHPPTPEEVQAQ